MRWWRTKPAGDEYVDISDHSRQNAIREALFHADADAHAKILRVSGKSQRKGKTITARVERIRTDRCTS